MISQKASDRKRVPHMPKKKIGDLSLKREKKRSAFSVFLSKPSYWTDVFPVSEKKFRSRNRCQPVE